METESSPVGRSRLDAHGAGPGASGFLSGQEGPQNPEPWMVASICQGVCPLDLEVASHGVPSLSPVVVLLFRDCWAPGWPHNGGRAPEAMKIAMGPLNMESVLKSLLLEFWGFIWKDCSLLLF